MYQANPRKAPARPAAANDRDRDPVEYCLDCWASWMHKDDRDLGVQQQRGESADGGAQARRDNEIAEATDAMMQSLVPRLQWAIKKKFGLARVWNFPNADLAQSYVDAVVELERKLKINIATRTLFG